jgi:membrane-associated protease RseP (regulator of RpoE activity)
VRPTPVQVALFLSTVGSTLLVGALHEGANPFLAPATLARGIPFAATLLSILFVHEMGHYVAARRSGVEVTLPYFIPAPTLLGTFGAFIRMRSPVTDRGALVMIGAAGPIAGFLIAVPALWIGVATSHVAPIPEAALQLGDSLLMRAAVTLIHGAIPAGQDLFLNSVGLAAWAGILVTALNLLPIGQLDGGHVAYGLFGSGSRWIALLTIAAIVVLARSWPGWIAWCVLPLVFGLRHPPPLYPERPLRFRHRVVGVAALLVFAICFIPVPLRLKP